MPAPNTVFTLAATGTTAPNINATDQGFGSIAVQVDGTFATLAATFQASLDGVTFYPIAMYAIAAAQTTVVTSAAAKGIWRTLDATGINYFNILVGTLTGGNVTFTVTWNAIL